MHSSIGEVREGDAFDVAVLGGGNAGLCAALTAHEAGARVIVVESAPRAFRGGNSRHTRNLRCIHDRPTELMTGRYSQDEFLADLMRVTGETDEDLARFVVRESGDCPEWMRRFGVRFQSSLRGTLHLGRTNVFFLGGGKALMNSYYAAAERRGIPILYDSEVIGLEIDEGHFRSALVSSHGQPRTIHAHSAVLASGGFESNIDWLREIWGEAADRFIIRGTPFNTGKILRAMLDAGAEPVAEASQCHAIAVDARAPKFDGGIVTRLDCVSLGIVVNANSERFYDEGEDFWPKRYAIWGGLIAHQPSQIAYAIVDRKAIGQFMPSMFPPIVADSIPALAGMLGVPAAKLEATVTQFNASVQPGSFNHSILDDCRTRGLFPEKTHWARPIDTPPFWGYPLRPGITFTYLGLKVDERARVVMRSGVSSSNICAAGEIMAGNILRKGYVAGMGMTIGTVFGRTAGKEAARHAVR